MPNPQDIQKGVVYTEDGGQNETTAEVAGSTQTDPLIYSSYNVVVQTRPWRFGEDGWDFTKSQTTIAVNRRPGQTN